MGRPGSGAGAGGSWPLSGDLSGRQRGRVRDERRAAGGDSRGRGHSPDAVGLGRMLRPLAGRRQRLLLLGRVHGRLPGPGHRRGGGVGGFRERRVELAG